MDNGLSIADVSAMTRGADGFLEGNGIIILILFFLMFGGGGFGSWNRGCDSPATTAQVYDSAFQQNVSNGLANIKEAVNCGTYENARLIDQVNYNGMQNTNNVVGALNNGFDSVTAQISALGYQMSQCCCDLKTQMLQDKYDATRYQLEQANTAVANAVQTGNILNSLGRYVTNPPCYGQYAPLGQYGYNFGTTIA